MELFNIEKPDPTEDRGAFIGGAIFVAVVMILLVGLGTIAPPDKRAHADRVSTLHVQQSSISR